jgi:exopolyphosphatase / guanosine-5'-triphosphate,3'-diphosphate pyrophosphatase
VRIAVVDIGTNSTRLLVADVEGDRIEELARDTTITRLGEGVDQNGMLLPEAIERVLAVCGRYHEVIERLSVDQTVAVLTSAVRDAKNGPELQSQLRDRFGFDAETIPGEQEARLTYLGATSGRRNTEPLLVLDIGGGSTEFVVGVRETIEFHVSTQIGAIRLTERHLRSDPPSEQEMERCAEGARADIERSVPHEVRRTPTDGIAVAGTPTSFAAIEQRLEPYDRSRVDGYRLTLEACERVLGELAALPLERRRKVPGLDPERAPAIVAGGIILREAMRAFELTSIEVSEHDILEGRALEAASEASAPDPA